MNIETYEKIFSQYILNSQPIHNSYIISRFDILLIPGEKEMMIAEVNSNNQVFVYKQIDSNDVSRIRRKSKSKRLESVTGLHQ